MVRCREGVSAYWREAERRTEEEIRKGGRDESGGAKGAATLVHRAKSASPGGVRNVHSGARGGDAGTGVLAAQPIN